MTQHKKVRSLYSLKIGELGSSIYPKYLNAD